MNVSAGVRALNPDLFPGTFAEPGGVKVVPVVKESLMTRHAVTVKNGNILEGLKGGKNRLRQDTKGMNKLEAEFHEFLLREFGDVNLGAVVTAQAFTLLLANGLRYTPDFVVMNPCCYRVAGDRTKDQRAYRMLAFETKGFMRDDAGAKIKMAARVYPWMTFTLVSKRSKKNGGGWDMQEILP